MIDNGYLRNFSEHKSTPRNHNISPNWSKQLGYMLTVKYYKANLFYVFHFQHNLFCSNYSPPVMGYNNRLVFYK